MSRTSEVLRATWHTDEYVTDFLREFLRETFSDDELTRLAATGRQLRLDAFRSTDDGYDEPQGRVNLIWGESIRESPVAVHWRIVRKFGNRIRGIRGQVLFVFELEFDWG